ncbi:MAG: Lrp/AsnC family transcriptional regulator [Propionibacteriaceae bacterium]|jgi:DNA-binding Lrp family transcriptional regulator|nr:Lrp/AsnC family transcriptional regulator [Propionibacteriaceae bacterium]
MDALDSRIIQALRADARESYAAIGARIGLSASAVKRRVDHLRERGVIRRFTVEVDESALGPRTEAYVELFCRGTISSAELRRVCAAVPEVVEACTVTGEADSVLRMRAANVHALEEALQSIRSKANIERTRSAVILTSLVERR